MTCAEDEKCTIYFLDQDGDGYPASSGYDVAGCSGKPPPDLLGRKYIDSFDAALDCDDSNADVHPKQTKYFTVARADGSFDYNCDGAETKQYGSGALFRQCTVCENPGAICIVGLGFPDDSCNIVTAAFANNVKSPDCGKTGTLVRCQVAGVCKAGSSVNEEGALQGCR